MERKWKYKDVHPETGKVFVSYKGDREWWVTRERFEELREKQREWQRSPAGKERARKRYLIAKGETVTTLSEIRRRKSPFTAMSNVIKGTAKKRNIDFALTADVLLEQWNRQSGKCYYTGLSMVLKGDARSLKQASVDRLDSSKGYTRDNIVLCCQSMNYAKNDYPEQEFRDFILEIKQI